MQTFERFITAVRLGAGLDRQTADRAAQAVLGTLFERISGGQAGDVAQQLKAPAGFLPSMSTLRSRPADRFELDEFLRRVAEREHVDQDVARAHTTTVLNALRLVIPQKEWADTVDQLPAEFEQLLSAPWRPLHRFLTVQALLEVVADRSGLSVEEARRVTEAVLEVLAERLPDQRVDELAHHLPDDVHPALDRGRARRTAPRRLDLEDFLQLLAERMGVDLEQARDRARIVLQALVKTVDDRMLGELLTELSDDYADLLVPTPSPAGSR